ncbi:GNAT family N-acetyltransferase [Roseisalinus antarcticus]|uniref:Ribosomal-protein-alanine N-acetyltransferase n=1 Tax=Roseisalinus antarcticus TaxID=254357 RepID=A0A1Y5RS83_9RHOB|nr:GNAT family N-acetyltransferase [Roseisalinus antarcticus]SLN23841.1 ribosomal-protein-alanine N-acetyltransferase [Roseisalinus antarcticus]
MTPEALAALYAAAFDDTQPWTPRDFSDLLASPGVFLLGDARAILLGRAIAGEAELLTLATHPAQRRKGLARALIDAFHAEARSRDASDAFLEVAADNAPARALYVASRYREAGRRKGYYRRATGPAVDALLLRQVLADPN